MSAPNRAAEAAESFHRHRDLLGSDDSRRGILFYICRDLNVQDAGNWGVLQKTDLGNFVPSDVIVWAPTHEWVDVINGTTKPESPFWDAHPPITNPAWLWMPADIVKPAGETPAPPPAPPLPFPTPARPSPEEVLTGVEVLKEALELLDRFVVATELLADAALRISEAIKGDHTLDVRVRL